MEKILKDGLVSSKPSAQKRKEKKADVIGLDSKRPVDAANVHSGPNLPPDEESDKELEKKLLEATAHILDQEREEARASIEKRKEVEFSDTEKRFIGPMIDDYSQYFFEKKEQAEKKRVKIDENWIEAIRQFYIDERKRWGMKRQIALEKAELLGKYLELNLPVGIPEKEMNFKEGANSNKNIPMEKIPVENADINSASQGQIKKEQENRREFSPEQIRELDDFCDVVKKEIDERFLSGRLNERTFLWEVKMAFKVVFKEDYIAEDIFPADYEDTAMEYIIKKVEDKLKI